MERLTELKFGENHSNAERNIWHMFKVIRTDRPEIDLRQVFDLRSKKTPENVV